MRFVPLPSCSSSSSSSSSIRFQRREHGPRTSDEHDGKEDIDPRLYLRKHSHASSMNPTHKGRVRGNGNTNCGGSVWTIACSDPPPHRAQLSGSGHGFLWQAPEPMAALAVSLPVRNGAKNNAKVQQ